MDVSVIFATHNRSDVIGDVLEAWREVHKYTLYQYEIICSDDASDDNTVELIRRASDLPITIIENEKGGASKARNAALEIASGKVIIFTGDDMFPCPNFVNAHYENYLKFGSNIATLGRIEWHKDLNLNHLMYHITNVGCEQFGFIGLPPYQLIDFRHFYTSNISVSRELLDKLDRYFNADFDKYGFEDIEFGYRLQKQGMRIYYDPDIVITHHHIYDSVDKFCNRQMCAGEELVVFNQMHNDLEDKCICDINNYKSAFEKYIQNCKSKRSLQGLLILKFISFAKAATRILEKLIQFTYNNKWKRIASLIYAGIFKFYFYYGCATRIAQNTGTTKSKIAHFTYKYMKKGYAQIYWDIGYGFNEQESRKWVCWDDSEWVIEKDLPIGVKQLRISPLKNECYAEVKEIYFITDAGAKEIAEVEWHNSRNGMWQNGDFSHTNDPQILIKNVKDDYKKIVVKMQVKDMKRKSLIAVIKRAAVKMYRKQEINNNIQKSYNVEYAEGQVRKIQLGIGGLDKETRNKVIKEYRERISILGDTVVISDIDDMQRGYTDYLYCPKKETLDSLQMMQVIYMLMNSVYDYVLVSKSYAEYPQIACKCIEDVLIYSSMISEADGTIRYEIGLGRYLRLPSFEVENNTINVLDIYPNLKLQQEYLLKQNFGMQPVFRMSKRNFVFEKKKPVVFVMPIFLAVGGVERNTIEVMRILKDKYTFCLITMERHSMEQGSLHYQLKGICDYVFDLRELMEFEHYLESLYELNEIFNPDVVWLCNNSPWFEVNTPQIRKIFEKTPIVAQDVYDTKVGWIEYYDTPGVKSFDRYIAISELISDTFKNVYQIPKDSIDIIYPVVDEARVKKALVSKATYEEICDKYGLDRKKEHFSFVGRLTEQKNPIRYLKLAEEVMQNQGDKIEFIMVGDGVCCDAVDRYIEEHSLQKTVKRIPYIAEVPEFVGILDGMIITSVYEGMPIVSIEAMSMSTPIMSTDIGDLKRFLKRTCGGIIIDEAKSDYENFVEFHNNISVYKDKAKEHANEILEFFSAENLAEKYVNTFEKAIESRAKY